MSRMTQTLFSSTFFQQNNFSRSFSLAWGYTDVDKFYFPASSPTGHIGLIDVLYETNVGIIYQRDRYKATTRRKGQVFLLSSHFVTKGLSTPVLGF